MAICSIVFVGLDSELDEDSMPFVFVFLLIKLTGGMPLAEQSKLLHEFVLIGSFSWVGGGCRSGLTSLPLRLLALLARPFPSALGHAFTPALCHARRA